MRVHNLTRDAELASDARKPQGFAGRMLGLLGRSSLLPGEALVLQPCGSVHTAFMRFAIDVIFVDRDDRVVKTSGTLKPFRMSGVLRGGHLAIELPAGTIERTGTARGDQLAFQN